ncbi:MAG: putative aminohydrolase SsnA [Anaerolineaceae bacterium]
MIITNGYIVTWEKPNQILTKHAIYVDGSIIKDIGDQEEILSKYPEEKLLDAQGQFIMPGNICAHTHFYGAFSRGLYIPGKPAKEFSEILEKLWWPLDQSLSIEDVYYSALVCIIDAIKHGTTTLFDHHASPGAIGGSLDAIAKAVEMTGIRASLAYEVTDRGGKEKAEEGIKENLRFINRIHNGDNADGRLAATFGLHASLTLSDETLMSCADALPAEVGFHIHAAEHNVDQYDSLQSHGLRVIDRLKKFGILGPRSIVAHGVHIDAKEMEILAETGTWVTHQPRSNMNNAVGVAEVESMSRAGIKVCLGNDGFLNTMWEEWKFAYLVQKLWNLDPRRMPGNEVAEMAIYNNASLASLMFGNGQIGKLAVGAQADIIFVDYKPFTEVTIDNLPWHILFGFNESMVSTTIVAGKILMDSKKLLTIDEKETAEIAMELSKKTWKRYHELF